MDYKLLIKPLVKLFVVIVIGVIVWNTNPMAPVREQVQSLIRQYSPWSKEVRFNNDEPPAVPREKEFIITAIPEKRGFRKCQRGSEVVYTNELCPTDAVEIQPQEPTMTVIAHPAATKPVQDPGSALRQELLGPDDKMSLRERMVERAVGR
jgi:hypothetical protein